MKYPKAGDLKILHKLPSWFFLIFPIILFATVIVTVITLVPYPFVKFASFWVLLIFAVTLSRMVEMWQYGIEIYNMTIFLVSFYFGLWSGIGMALVTLIGCLYSVFFIRKHYLIHTLPGPINQTVAFIPVIIPAAILGAYFPEFTLANLTLIGTFIVGIGTSIQLYLGFRLCGVPGGRQIASGVVAVLINYNLFLLAAPWLLNMFRTVGTLV